MDTYQNTAPANHLLEIRFQSKQIYQHPFFDVHLDVIFTDPTGTQRTVPAFWAGNHCWKVRYSSNVIGKHQYRSLCNDVSNADLHQLEGTVETTADTGDNALLSLGAPLVAKDSRHFSHADGSPFFWLGDTWWMGLTKRLSLEDFKTLAEDRQKKGFTVVQLVAGLYPDMAAFDARGESNAGFAWEKDFKTINPAFFDEADTRIMHLISLGITPCILGCWGYYLQWLGTNKMQLHWRYLMARWAALPVVWAAAGEQIMPWYLSEQDEKDSAWLKHEWSTIIRYMRSINVFNRMITTHPQTTARNCVDDPSLLDFDMQQTDHRAPTFLQAARATEGWQSTPVMPVMNGESRYEALEITPKVTTANVRQAFWAHMLNSGCAGHTYGANGIWQANRDGEPFGKSPNGHNWGNTPWDTAMKLPGASQLSIAKELLLSLPWETLEPIALSASRWPKYVNYLMYFFQRHQQAVAAATTPNGRVALYYVLNLKPIILNMQYWTKPMNAVWFDPTNGSRVRVSSIPTNQTETFMCKPPGCNGANEKDWLLLITRA